MPPCTDVPKTSVKTGKQYNDDLMTVDIGCSRRSLSIMRIIGNCLDGLSHTEKLFLGVVRGIYLYFNDSSHSLDRRRQLVYICPHGSGSMFLHYFL